jgi:hypothetical protein
MSHELIETTICMKYNSFDSDSREKMQACMDVMTGAVVRISYVQNPDGSKCDSREIPGYEGVRADGSRGHVCMKFATKEMGVKDFCETYDGGDFKGCFKCVVDWFEAHSTYAPGDKHTHEMVRDGDMNCAQKTRAMDGRTMTREVH